MDRNQLRALDQAMQVYFDTCYLHGYHAFLHSTNNPNRMPFDASDRDLFTNMTNLRMSLVNFLDVDNVIPHSGSVLQTLQQTAETQGTQDARAGVSIETGRQHARNIYHNSAAFEAIGQIVDANELRAARAPHLIQWGTAPHAQPHAVPPHLIQWGAVPHAAPAPAVNAAPNTVHAGAQPSIGPVHAPVPAPVVPAPPADATTAPAHRPVHVAAPVHRDAPAPAAPVHQAHTPIHPTAHATPFLAEPAPVAHAAAAPAAAAPVNADHYPASWATQEQRVQAQNFFRTLGVDAGENGEVGDKLHRAVFEFQAAHHLTVDARITPELLTSLRAAADGITSVDVAPVRASRPNVSQLIQSLPSLPDVQHTGSASAPDAPATTPARTIVVEAGRRV